MSAGRGSAVIEDAGRTGEPPVAGGGTPAGDARAGRPTTARRGGASRRRRRLRGVIGVAVAFAVWAAVTQTGAIDAKDVPPIPAVARALGGSWHEIASGLGVTLESLFIGLAIAALAGAVFGLGVGLSTWADAATDVIVRMMRPLPSLALIPIAILLAGMGTTMTSGLVAFAAFWPVFINARYGVRQVEPLLLDTGRALGFGRLQLVRRVVVPSVAPAIVTGIRIAAGVAIVVTVSVELVAGTGGLGGYVLSAEQGGSTPQMYAGIVVGGIVGWALNLAFGAISRVALRWDAAASARGERA